ncbi:MAG: hypothetical protein M3Q10_02420, partial [Chloroflexota bacterium]|nr:hypothetical protein [Chloroflexota bacterium]
LIPLGDESRIVATDVAGAGDTPASRLELTLRRGNVLASVAAVDYSGERGWGVLVVERLAAALLVRIEAVSAGEAPGLAPRLLRFADAGLPPPAFDAYDRLGGATFALYGVDPVDSADRAALYGRATDVYTHEQVLVGGGAPVAYAAKLYRFPDAAAAAAWLAAAPETLFADPGSFLDLALVEAAATVGEESRTIAYAFPATEEATTRGYRVYARVGNAVARVQLDGVPEVPLAAVEAVARAQVACLARPVCGDAPPLAPERLVPATPGAA